jgi:hypothetical protein
MWRDVLRSSKSKPVWLGTGRVLRKTKGNTYVIQDEHGRILPRNRPREQLRFVNDDDVQQEDQPTSVIDHKDIDGQRQFLVTLTSGNELWANHTDIDIKLIEEYFHRRFAEGWRPPLPPTAPAT